MSAIDNLSPPQFYHGTNAELSPGDVVSPGHKATFGKEPMTHVYATTHLEAAKAYGMSRKRLHGGESHVYSVSAEGAEPDPEGKSAGKGAHRATSLTVLGEV
jgi:hypothetical protein